MQTEISPLPLPEHLFDIFAEKACLGAILRGHKYALDVLSKTSHKDFGVAHNWRIVKIAEDLFSEGEEISFVSLRDSLERRGWLVSVGGEDVLRRISEKLHIDEQGNLRVGAQDNMIFSSCSFAAQLVREKAGARRLIQGIESNADKLRALEIPPIDVCESLRELIVETQTSIDHPAKTAADMLDKQLDHIQALLDGKPMATPIGIVGFDKETGGLGKGDVLLIVAPTKGAKSVLSLDIADFFVQNNRPVAYFSMEMRLEELERRRLCKRVNSLHLTHSAWHNTRITLNQIEGKGKHRINQHEAELLRLVAYDVSKEPLFLVGPEIRDRIAILMEAERLITQESIELLVFDYIQLIKGRQGESDYKVYTEFAQDVKALCNRFGVAAVLPSQINNEAQRLARAFKNLSADDAHGSGELQKSATIITTLYLEKEQFYCGCPEQQYEEEIWFKNSFKKVPRRLHEFRPTNGICAACMIAKRDPYVKEVPFREGSWIIERGRSCAGGTAIPIQFEGRYMQFKEVVS